ncbi:hypothetical protein [Haloferula sargassicola]|uniref:Lipoprotein n=1 Tax=Haloferula sargassicola TaxID=490096 RepID=A0ABP9UV61_9BACT
MSHRFFPTACVLVGCLASCAGEKSAEQPVAAAAHKKTLEDFGTYNPNYSGGARKSAMENSQANSMYEGELSKREFVAKDYAKKSFWGTKDYAKQVYGGDTDGSRFMTAAREGSSGAREGAMVSRDSGRNYTTDAIGTGAAREAGMEGIATTSDAETDLRRRVWKQPEIRDYRSERSLTVEETNSMLGR